MFDSRRFSEILQKISNSYDSISDFAKHSNVNRTYLSKYINLKLDTPPTPKIISKIAAASNKITSYEELMEICGYSKISIITPSTFAPEVSLMEWKMIFGKYELIELTDNERLAFGKMIDVIDNVMDTDNGFYQMHFSSENYTRFATSNSEKDIILRLYLYFMLIISRVIGDSDFSKDVLEQIKLLTPLEINRNTLSSHSQFYMCPVYGQISAGQPNWAEECLEGYLPLDPQMMNISNPEECFFLRVNGESMNKEIKNGAYALIRKTDVVENGEIAVVLVDKYDATLKKFTQQGDLIILEPMSTDPSFTTQVYGKDTEIKILGKYIGKMEMK